MKKEKETMSEWEAAFRPVLGSMAACAVIAILVLFRSIDDKLTEFQIIELFWKAFGFCFSIFGFAQLALACISVYYKGIFSDFAKQYIVWIYYGGLAIYVFVKDTLNGLTLLGSFCISIVCCAMVYLSKKYIFKKK